MSKREDTLYIQDIRDSIAKIEDYVNGLELAILLKIQKQLMLF